MKKPPTEKKPLTFTRETLLKLDRVELVRVAGGQIPPSIADSCA